MVQPQWELRKWNLWWFNKEHNGSGNYDDLGDRSDNEIGVCYDVGVIAEANSDH